LKLDKNKHNCNGLYAVDDEEGEFTALTSGPFSTKTFLAEPESREKLGNIRQLMAADCTTPLEEAKDKAA
jgi:hypothetical protein